MSTSLESIFDVVEQRIESLGGMLLRPVQVVLHIYYRIILAIYKQVHADRNSRLENFALGMVS